MSSRFLRGGIIVVSAPNLIRSNQLCNTTPNISHRTLPISRILAPHVLVVNQANAIIAGSPVRVLSAQQLRDQCLSELLQGER